MTAARGAGRADAIIVGGGFYGCCLALVLRSLFDKVVVLEARDDLLTRASYVNQARVHTGFHYPRSFVTALRSLALHERFRRDFAPAIHSDFRMLYAIARTGSKITPHRFEMMFSGMNAPISAASRPERALFDTDRVAEVFRCEEAAFNSTELRRLLRDRLAVAGVEVRTRAEVTGIEPIGPHRFRVTIAGAPALVAASVFDASYGQTTNLGFSRIRGQLKFEETEVALIDPPEELRGFGVTVMDGPFFSTMPFPAEDCYSLTHVRYTPGASWTAASGRPPGAGAPRSRWLHMARDGARYLPSLARLGYRNSLFETKTVLLRNEGDDGRPILLEQHPDMPGLFAIMGGKFDNIYDLFDTLRDTVPGFAALDERWLEGRGP